MTVYVVQEVPGRNILGAKEYGELEVLLPPGMNIVLSSTPTIRRLEKKLQNFCDEDYLLLIGDPAAIGIACCVASNNNIGKMKLLKWDRERKEYYPVQIDLFKKGEENV